MEILDKKLKQVSRAKAWVFEHSEFHVLQRNVNFLSLRNLLSNELFFTFINLQQFSFCLFFIFQWTFIFSKTIPSIVEPHPLFWMFSNNIFHNIYYILHIFLYIFLEITCLFQFYFICNIDGNCVVIIKSVIDK